MYKKVKFVFFIVSFITFIILTISYYFSDQNIQSTNKSRSLYSLNLSNKIIDIPFLRNDTDDVINYKDDVENYIKKKKNYTFWKLLKKNDE